MPTESSDLAQPLAQSHDAPCTSTEDHGRALHYREEGRKPGRGEEGAVARPWMINHHKQGPDCVAKSKLNPPRCWLFRSVGHKREALGHLSHLCHSAAGWLFPHQALLRALWPTPPLSWGPWAGRGQRA